MLSFAKAKKKYYEFAHQMWSYGKNMSIKILWNSLFKCDWGYIQWALKVYSVAAEKYATSN